MRVKPRKIRKGVVENYIQLLYVVNILVKSETPFVMSHVCKSFPKFNGKHVTALRKLLINTTPSIQRGFILYKWKKPYSSIEELTKAFRNELLSSEKKRSKSKVLEKEDCDTLHKPMENTNIMLGVF